VECILFTLMCIGPETYYIYIYIQKYKALLAKRNEALENRGHCFDWGCSPRLLFHSSCLWR